MEISPEFRPLRSWYEDDRPRNIVVISLSVACVLFSLWAVTVGWNNTIFDAHAFRQSQTAIAAYYIRAGHNLIRYETPALGPPWSIPFELPLFEAIVAAISRVGHTPLDQAGRFTSILFFYATCWPLFILLRQIGIGRLSAAATAALFTGSPHYIFWSHTFMIESTALFFAGTYLASVVAAISRFPAGRRPAWPYILLSAVLGSLAGTIKVTTYVPFLLAAGLWILYGSWRYRANPSSNIRAALLAFFAIAVPCFLTMSWTYYADLVKEENPMGHFLTSRNLRPWILGSIHQRLALNNYTNFAGLGIGHVIDNIVGSRYLLLLALLIVLVVRGRYLLAFLASVSLYVAGFGIFFNLHFIHTYYEYANGVFAVAAIGIAIAALLERGGWTAWMGVLVFIVAIGACVAHYFPEYYSLQHTNKPGRPAAAAIIDRDTKPTDVIMVYGLDWSPAFPYQAGRRAVMAFKAIGEPPLDREIANFGASHVSALVLCGDGRSNSAALLEKWHGLGFTPARSFKADDCEIYER